MRRPHQSKNTHFYSIGKVKQDWAWLIFGWVAGGKTALPVHYLASVGTIKRHEN
jgi:hypothetical protein